MSICNFVTEKSYLEILLNLPLNNQVVFILPFKKDVELTGFQNIVTVSVKLVSI